MIKYNVYDIGKKANKRASLSNSQIKNIESLIKNKTNSLEGISVTYQLINGTNDNMLYDFNQKYLAQKIDEFELDSALDDIAEKLLKAELTGNDSGGLRRNKNITEGILFIKYSFDTLTLLKLESTDIIDRDSFESRQELSSDKEYYKIAVIKKDELDNIIIVDRNKTIAKYWAENFLELARKRDSFTNTEALMKMLEKSEVINEKALKDVESYNQASHLLKEVLYESYYFNKEDLFQTIVQDNTIEFTSEIVKSDDIFDEKLKDILDDEFDIDKSVVYKYKREKIKVIDEIIIDVKNFEKMKRRKLINFDENEKIITIKVDDENYQRVSKKFLS